jgi:hypothetical protein
MSAPKKPPPHRRSPTKLTRRVEPGKRVACLAPGVAAHDFVSPDPKTVRICQRCRERLHHSPTEEPVYEWPFDGRLA